MRAGHLFKDFLDFLLAENRGRSPLSLGPYVLEELVDRLVQHSAVKEDNGIQGLPLSTGGDISLDRQMAQERFYFFFAHILGMNFCIKKPDETHDPLTISLFGAVRIVVVPENLPNLVHEF
jgi:hypothetical protein